MKRFLSLLLASVLVLGLIGGTALAAPSKTDTTVITDVTHDGTHEDWTVKDPDTKLTVPEASRITGDPQSELAIIWQKQFDTTDYPAVVSFHVPETDGLEVYVFQYYGGGWHIIATTKGPDFTATVNQGGPIAIVTHSKKASGTSPKTGVESMLPLTLATLAFCGAVCLGALAWRKRRA